MRVQVSNNNFIDLEVDVNMSAMRINDIDESGWAFLLTALPFPNRPDFWYSYVNMAYIICLLRAKYSSSNYLEDSHIPSCIVEHMTDIQQTFVRKVYFIVRRLLDSRPLPPFDVTLLVYDVDMYNANNFFYVACENEYSLLGCHPDRGRSSGWDGSIYNYIIGHYSFSENGFANLFTYLAQNVYRVNNRITPLKLLSLIVLNSNETTFFHDIIPELLTFRTNNNNLSLNLDVTKTFYLDVIDSVFKLKGENIRLSIPEAVSKSVVLYKPKLILLDHENINNTIKDKMLTAIKRTQNAYLNKNIYFISSNKALKAPVVASSQRIESLKDKCKDLKFVSFS